MSKFGFKEHCLSIKPTAFLDYREYLRQLYQHLKRELPNYSYIRFSTDIGFSATNISNQIIKGRRPLSEKAAKTVVSAIGITKTDRRYFLTLIRYNNATDSVKREHAFQALMTIKNEVLPTSLDRDQLTFLSEWFHPVIRELVGMKSFNPDPKWIAKKLVPSIRPEQASRSIKLLERLKLIQFDSDKSTYVLTDNSFTTGHETTGIAVTRYHQKMIDLGKETLTRVDSNLRDISGVTVRLSDEGIKHLKMMIHQFQLQVLEMSENEDQCDKIYQLNLQMFPLTNDDSSDGGRS